LPTAGRSVGWRRRAVRKRSREVMWERVAYGGEVVTEREANGEVENGQDVQDNGG